jgi:single-strand DNA-binding protein
MANYNKVILLGRLTRDPQLTYTPTHTAIIDFGLATNRQWKGQDGSQREETCFVDCQMFGKRAEVINKYIHKGDPLFVEGRLKLDSWQDKEGNKRSRLRVFVENFEFMGGGKGQGAGGSSGGEADVGDNVGKEPFGGEAADDIPF